ncbi:hypothetical protein NMY22_g19052 [Coprinellus aureogranulatus]|nr:hypothetical protein NMY22_g19052 [Coprinellus aureogranulatus]
MKFNSSREFTYEREIVAPYETVFAILQDPYRLCSHSPHFGSMVPDDDSNDKVTESPAKGRPSKTQWYRITDRIPLLGPVKATISIRAKIVSVEGGVETEVEAGFGTKVKAKYSVKRKTAEGGKESCVLSEVTVVEVRSVHHDALCLLDIKERPSVLFRKYQAGGGEGVVIDIDANVGLYARRAVPRHEVVRTSQSYAIASLAPVSALLIQGHCTLFLGDGITYGVGQHDHFVWQRPLSPAGMACQIVGAGPMPIRQDDTRLAGIHLWAVVLEGVFHDTSVVVDARRARYSTELLSRI